MRSWRRRHTSFHPDGSLSRWGWASLLTIPVSLACGLIGCATPGSIWVVNVPVADLRAQPNSLATPLLHDPLEESQVLYGERVRVISMQETWAFVEAIEQPERTHGNRWQGYPGWIPRNLLTRPQRPGRPNAIVTAKWTTVWKDPQGETPWFHLPMGAKVRVTDTAGNFWRVRLLNETSAWITRGEARFARELDGCSTAEKRRFILRAAEELLGDPYYWGGRSPFGGSSGSPPTGVDCSGLVNLAYRTVGIDLPRDAHEQYLRARKTRRLEPGDLVFLSEPDHPRQIVHVMLYAGDGWLLEGPGTGQAIRRISVVERLGRPLDQLKPGDRVGRQRIVFGAYLP